MNPFQLQLSKVFFMKSSGMTEQGSCWIPRKSERPAQKNFKNSIAECGLKLMRVLEQERKRAHGCPMG